MSQELARVEGVVAYTSELPHGDPVVVWAPLSGSLLPVVVLIHGSHCRPQMYTLFASLLAERGFVVVAPEHRRELFGDVAHYPQQAFVNWAMDFAGAENARAGSPVAGRVDISRVLISGHSMGGGATLGIASDTAQFGLVVDEWSMPTELVAVAVSGTHNIPPPRTGDPIPVNNLVPIAFLQGTIDDVVKLDQVERTFAVVHGVTPRLFVEVIGGNHFFLTDTDSPGGANADRRPMELDQEVAVRSAADWTATWFEANLGDADAMAALRRGASADAEPHLRVTLIED
jgi:predicted dienelactone hydrolase